MEFIYSFLKLILSERMISCFHRSSRNIFLFLLVFVIVSGVVFVNIVVKGYACDPLDSERMINELCSKYHNRRTFGNMCHILCDPSKFRLKYCNGDRTQYKKVAVLECDGCIKPGKQSTVVLKSEYTIADLHSDLIEQVKATNNISLKVELVENVFRKHAMEFFDSDLSDKRDFVSVILGADFKRVVKDLNTDQAIDDALITALLLGSQDEFFTFRLLGARSYFPGLYGTCGHAYFVEFTPSLSSMNFIMFMSNSQELFSANPLVSQPWPKRADAALQTLEIVRQVEDSYPTPMHMCGSTAQNFGMSETGNVVVLDIDDVRFGRVVRTGHCDIDKHCAFNGCYGKCNVTTHTCEKVITSNNLQIICLRLFISKVARFGLLRGAPASIASPLQDLLDKCIHPRETIYKLPRDNKSDRKLMRQMELLLTKSLRNV